MWPALGCLWVSSDFIRKKKREAMAEAIPPDISQLPRVGERLCLPACLLKKIKK